MTPGKRIGLLATLLAISLWTSLSTAAKPGGGGGGSSTGGGTIYFSTGSVLNAMNSDGSGKRALPVNVNAIPSRLVHGGHRWFLQGRFHATATFPNGLPVREYFAIRDDGNESFTVQLTSDPTLQFIGAVNWAPGEQADSGWFTGMARRWVFDGVNWVIDPNSVGVYLATVLFDADGDAVGLETPPVLMAQLDVIPSINAGEWYADSYSQSFDWSPDLLEFVFSTYDRSELRIMDVLSGQSRVIATGGSPYGAVWSPAGDLIAFGNGFSSIETIRPDGSSRNEIIRYGVSYGNFWPEWSPTGSHLVYGRDPGWDTTQRDVYRATLSGATKANLTSDIPGSAFAMAWR